MMRRYTLAVTLFVLGWAGSVSAHDFWIECSPPALPAPGEVKISLRVGERFQGDPVARNPAKIERFFISGPQGEKDIGGQGGDEPAGSVHLQEPGLYAIGYRSKPSSIELEAEKFEAYLKEEGLESIIEARAKRGESQKPGREIYSRCAKSLLTVGDGREEDFDRAIGLTLELIPEKDPCTGGSGEWPVRILYDGQPLSGALIVAMNRDEPDAKQSVRSDDRGRAVFTLNRGGLWLVKAVHIVPAPKDSGADWESLWASLTFVRR